MSDWTMYFNGREYPIARSFVALQNGMRESWDAASGNVTIEFTSTMTKRKWRKLCVVTGGIKPHRSHRVNARRDTRQRKALARDMKRRIGSHLRWQRVVEFEKAKRLAADELREVETMTPSGIAVVVRPTPQQILERVARDGAVALPSGYSLELIEPGQGFSVFDDIIREREDAAAKLLSGMGSKEADGVD